MSLKSLVFISKSEVRFAFNPRFPNSNFYATVLGIYFTYNIPVYCMKLWNTRIVRKISVEGIR